MDKYDERIHDATEQDIPVYVWLGLLLSFLAGMIGGLAGGYLGWLVQEGIVTVGAAILGFLVCFFIAAATTGPLKYVYGQVAATVAPPEMKRWKTTGLSSWDLYVTVHQVKNVYISEGLLAWMVNDGADSYCEVKVGRFIEPDFFKVNQPVKHTCVNKQNVFEESFHFVVSPTDDHVRIILWDQDIFADDMVGVCDINITDEILLGGFPQRKGYRLIHAKNNPDDDFSVSHLAGTVILSFSPGGAFPQSVYDTLQSQKPLHYQKMREEQATLIEATGKTASYGTWATSAAGHGHGAQREASATAQGRTHENRPAEGP